LILEENKMPDTWMIPDHDLALIIAVKENGIGILKSLRTDSRY